MHVSDDPRVGTELAGYRLEALLGLGGMSVVYLAEDLRLKRRVALKLLSATLAEDDEFRDRFLRESELAASIDHPNIVPIYEAGGTGDVLFIAMRYVEGGDLKRRLRHGPLDATVAFGILAQVAVALDAAHARGLVHRDVKPSNVLLDTGARPDASDHAYLTDFGLMRRISEEARGADGGHLAGTIDYVAPEQIADAPLDGRADVYSLGCVLYECLVGEPPFREESELAVVFAHLEMEPPSPSTRRPELPAALDAVIARAMAKEPERRYATCTELARAALSVSVGEASRRLAHAASRTAAGRSDLSEAEAELAGTVSDLRAVREQARALNVAPTRDASGAICPFKGLASFEAADADVFFGRERLVAELVARLAGAGFLGIVGPSGSGKSSVLRAGLLPALADGALPGSGAWRRWLLRPGERPLGALRAVLASDAPDPLAEALEALPDGTRLLVAVDQLEELFTACRDEAERVAFADLLARAATDEHGRALVVVAVRADFYGRFASHPALAELLGGNHVLVGPMQPSELRRAIELPARSVRLRVEPELADALVDDVEGEPGALPLLSTALLELWQNRRAATLTLASYRRSGGVHGAVARLAEGTYAHVPDDRKQLVRAVMLRLVGEGEGDAPVRRRAPLAELDLERDEDVADVLATLADSRLVTVGEGSVEVAHEALLREWPRLREWIDEDAAGRRLRHHLTRAATEWDAAERDTGELYRGARLAAALDWSAEHAVELNELEREFLGASRDASEYDARRARRTNRRLRTLLAGVAILLAAAVAGGIFALVQRGEARDAETAQVAQRLGAQALADEDLDRSLLLARQAVEIADTPQTRGYLLTALMRAPTAVGVMHGPAGSNLWGVALSPDGRTLVASDFYSRLVFFDAHTYDRIGKPLDLGGWIDSVAFSPDGAAIAYGAGGVVRRIDLLTREESTTAVEGRAARLAFSRDGSRLVVMMEGGTIYVRDAVTLEPVGNPIRPGGFRPSYIQWYYRPPHFALTPDGRTVVTASDDGELAWWDLKSGRKTRSREIPTGYHAVALSPDGSTAAVGVDRGAELVDLRTGATRTARAGFSGRPNWLLFSPDGLTLVSTNEDETVTVWDAASPASGQLLRGHSNSVLQPAFSPDGNTLYTASGDGTVIAWDLAGSRSIKRPFTFTHDRDFNRVYDGHPGRFSPDGRLIAVGLKDDGVALLDARNLTPVGTRLVGTSGEVKALAFAPDGRTLATVSDGSVMTRWDVPSRSRRGDTTFVGGAKAGVGFTPDGTTLVTPGLGRPLQLFDAATGAPVVGIGSHRYYRPSDVALDARGTLAAVALSGGNTAEVWNLATRARLANVRGRTEGDAIAVALSPDGRLLAVGGYPRLVGLWEVRTGKLVHELDLAGAGAVSLRFSPDGRVLAASGFEPAASLWDVASGVRIGPTLTVGSRTVMIDLSPDGRRLLLTNGDGRGAVFDIDPASWARRACAVANRTLTREEWETFLPGRPYEPACAS